ncbi:MAG: serine/threonine-protein kinase [Myxococcota bacterium]
MSARVTPSLPEGTVINGYRLGRCLGSGSMGEVYEAKHSVIGRRVAIKVLRPGADELLNAGQRLLEEARSVNAIHHPGIVDVFDLGMAADRRPYLVMELLHGRPLSLRIKQGPVPFDEAKLILEGVLEPLAAAHRAGVVHRDLKPSNIFLLDERVGRVRVKLVDFGVARREGRKELLTAPSMAVGSMGFMAPEQIMGHAEPASDLYAIGCVAFLMLTGRPVFPTRNIPENARAHVQDPAPKVRTLKPELPGALETWVAQLLEKEPGRRHANAEIALAALKLLDGRVGATTELVPAFVPTERGPVPTVPANERATVPGRPPNDESDQTMLDG